MMRPTNPSQQVGKTLGILSEGVVTPAEAVPPLRRDDTLVFGQRLVDNTSLIFYPADALPQDSDPAWTEWLQVPATASCARSILTVESD
jgi:hypothetical protein